MENSANYFSCTVCCLLFISLWQVSCFSALLKNSLKMKIKIALQNKLFLINLSSLFTFRFQICWTLSWDKIKTFGDNWNWERWNTIPTTTVNSTLAVHAIMMLSLCYLPGLLASYLQLIRGTKYSRFPNWLDKWLRMRKQLGLLMLFSASLHVRENVHPIK